TIEGNATQYKYYPSVSGITVISDRSAFTATRAIDSNVFTVPLNDRYQQYKIPFKTNNGQLNIGILEAACGKPVEPVSVPSISGFSVIRSQPLDSLLRLMMHRSDNFFAEQTLLMLSNEMTGVMNDAKIIDSLLKTDLSDLPQKPRWVDGSGLSRYNLFSPDDMVAVLTKMKTEFDWNRITTILPTGGEGTLTSYYRSLKDRFFAKTGTLSNNIALSGFLVTNRNKTLVFSVLVNNHMGNTTQIRKAVEKFLYQVAEQN
ncbi:MAG TPA: D-alanyl-D-alanine carboxypeptidase, partial [Chitinophagaceae bacterium]